VEPEWGKRDSLTKRDYEKEEKRSHTNRKGRGAPKGTALNSANTTPLGGRGSGPAALQTDPHARERTLGGSSQLSGKGPSRAECNPKVKGKKKPRKCNSFKSTHRPEGRI